MTEVKIQVPVDQLEAFKQLMAEKDWDWTLEEQDPIFQAQLEDAKRVAKAVDDGKMGLVSHAAVKAELKSPKAKTLK